MLLFFCIISILLFTFILYHNSIPRESIVDVSGVVRLAKVTSTTQNTIELAVQTFFVVSRSQPNIPFLVEDAARPQNLSDQVIIAISLVNCYTFIIYIYCRDS